MGGCISCIPVNDVPVCLRCGKEGPGIWADMTPAQRQDWVWEGTHPMCQKCYSAQTPQEKARFEKVGGGGGAVGRQRQLWERMGSARRGHT